MIKKLKSVKHFVTNPYSYENCDMLRVYRLNEFEDGYRELLMSNIGENLDLNPKYLSKKFGSLDERKQIVKDRLESKNFDWIQLRKNKDQSYDDLKFKAALEHKAYSYWQLLYNTNPDIDYELQKLENDKNYASSIQEFRTQCQNELDNKAQDVINTFGDESISVPKGFLTWLIQNELDMQGDQEFGNEVYHNVVKLMLKQPKFNDLDVDVD